jgi:hypothetical protein
MNLIPSTFLISTLSPYFPSYSFFTDIFTSHLIYPSSIFASEMFKYFNVSYSSFIANFPSSGWVISGSVTISIKGIPALL